MCVFHLNTHTHTQICTTEAKGKAHLARTCSHRSFFTFSGWSMLKCADCTLFFKSPTCTVKTHWGGWKRRSSEQPDSRRNVQTLQLRPQMKEFSYPPIFQRMYFCHLFSFSKYTWKSVEKNGSFLIVEEKGWACRKRIRTFRIHKCWKYILDGRHTHLVQRFPEQQTPPLWRSLSGPQCSRTGRPGRLQSFRISTTSKPTEDAVVTSILLLCVIPMTAVRSPIMQMETKKQAQPFQYSVGGTKANKTFQKTVRKCLT